MTAGDTFRVVRRNLGRRPLRTVLTIVGVGFAVMLLIGIEAFSAGMDEALKSGDKHRTLVVYRQNRYCPQTSFLPERYTREIEGVPGVESVLPVKVFLNNCRTNLDMITFQGSPPDRLLSVRNLEILEGDVERFRSEGDAALVGREFARRRGLRVGDKFRFGAIVVKVAGIFASKDSTQEALVLTHLEFLQRAGPINRLGTVTQFEVKVQDPARSKEIAAEIDRRLATAEEPTDTRAMAAFLERATRDLREILGFGRIFGVACVLMVMILVANTIYMSVHERRREFGIFRAIGFHARQLAVIVLAETTTLGLLGSLLGLAAIYPLISWTGIAVGVEGVQVGFAFTPVVVVLSLLVVSAAALVAGLLPALEAAHTNIVRAIRSGA